MDGPVARPCLLIKHACVCVMSESNMSSEIIRLNTLLISEYHIVYTYAYCKCTQWTLCPQSTWVWMLMVQSSSSFFTCLHILHQVPSLCLSKLLFSYVSTNTCHCLMYCRIFCKFSWNYRTQMSTSCRNTQNTIYWRILLSLLGDLIT